MGKLDLTLPTASSSDRIRIDGRCLLLSSVVVTFSAAGTVRVPPSTVVDLTVALVDGPGFLSTSPAFNSSWDMISGPIMSPYKNTMMVQL